MQQQTKESPLRAKKDRKPEQAIDVDDLKVPPAKDVKGGGNNKIRQLTRLMPIGAPVNGTDGDDGD
ncbi:MAG: hypothetical protein ABI882_11885 [Acidobacteriota bacterium]